jgi:DNA polymerase III subunit chi
MPAVRFYNLVSEHLKAQPLLMVAKLAERAFEQQQSCQILVRDDNEAENVDEMLWSYSEDAFLPHQIGGQDDDDECPVLILTPALALQDRAITINLRNQLFDQLTGLLLEMIPPDEVGKAEARARFKHYKNSGNVPTLKEV